MEEKKQSFELQKLFDKFDKDNSGTLDISELDAIF